MRTRGGEERVVVELARGLMERGHEVALACDPAGPLLDELDEAVSVFGVDYYAGNLAAARATSRVIGSWRPDLLHCHGTRPGFSARLAAVRRRCPVVWTIHLHPLWGPMLANSWGARVLFRATLFALDPFTSATVSVSQALGRKVEEFARPVRLRCTPLANGIDTEHLRPDPEAGREFRRQHGLDSDRVLAVMLARLTPRKGIDQFLQALARTRDESVVGMVAGEGEDRPRLEAMVRDLGLQDRFTLLGELHDPRPLMAAADLGLLPSSGEGLPLCVMEMLACGLPVALSDLPEHAEFRAVGDPVAFFPLGNPAPLAELLDRGTQWREASLCSRAREGSVELFSLTRMVDEYAALYESALR